MTENQNKKFLEILKDFDTAMLVTRSDSGLLGRPMAIVDVEENGNLWFISGEATEKTREIEVDPTVLVTCQKDHGRYLSLSGTASIVRDRSKIDQLWKESFQVWFPNGKNDPNVSLIYIETQRGEYWDTSGLKKITYLFQAASAYLTGKPPKIDEGREHGEVRL